MAYQSMKKVIKGLCVALRFEQPSEKELQRVSDHNARVKAGTQSEAEGKKEWKVPGPMWVLDLRYVENGVEETAHFPYLTKPVVEVGKNYVVLVEPQAPVLYMDYSKPVLL